MRVTKIKITRSHTKIRIPEPLFPDSTGLDTVIGVIGERKYWMDEAQTNVGELR